MTAQTCHLCSDSSRVSKQQQANDWFLVDCPRCGRYFVTRNCEEFELTQGYDQEKRARVRIATREASEIKGWLHIKEGDLDRIAERVHISDSSIDRINHILLWLSRHTPHLGQYKELKSTDFPLLRFRTHDEMSYALGHLIKAELVERAAGGQDLWRLTVAGIERIHEITYGKGAGRLVFVAMSFDPTDRHIYDEGIAPAVVDAGYEPIRVDDIPHVELIDDVIIGRLRTAAFVVADFTKNKKGVYFEAGFGMGLGRPVFWTCMDNEDEKKGIHFDTNHRGFVMWKDTNDLRSQLRIRIEAVVGKFSPAQ